jgi:hypothetical protein
MNTQLALELNRSHLDHLLDVPRRGAVLRKRR